MDDDRVPPGCECPRCGEARVDRLVLWETEPDDEVHCATCLAFYRIPMPPAVEDLVGSLGGLQDA